MDARRDMGNSGEAEAAAFLQKKGMHILATQVRTPAGEIDLVCQDGLEIVFVEVKKRSSTAFGFPEESVTPKKLHTLEKCVEWFLRKTGNTASPFRIDVVAVLGVHEPVIEHFEAIDIPEIT